jgi:hypothetical protein
MIEKYLAQHFIRAWKIQCQLGTNKMKKYFLVILPIFSCALINAQETPQQLLAGMRSLCLEVVDKDMVRDMSKFSSEPLNSERVCDCASERLVDDSIVKLVAGLTKAQIHALPKAQQMLMYLSAKFYSASLSCYADAIRTSADHIDIAR